MPRNNTSDPTMITMDQTEWFTYFEKRDLGPEHMDFLNAELLTMILERNFKGDIDAWKGTAKLRKLYWTQRKNKDRKAVVEVDEDAVETIDEKSGTTFSVKPSGMEVWDNLHRAAVNLGVKYLRGVVSQKKSDIDKMPENPLLQKEHNILSVIEQLGEGMSEATKALKKDEGGRKVDLLFFRRNIELGNIEFKCANPRPSEIRRQHSKNIRINRAIMESHFNAYDQRYEMMFMDIQGI
ncbi:hypothetical protein BGX31_009768 [Mortierella sp. GBA43]|nr:hypothetical protein BGX31_009768 [Mortierella sp. GBA43]